MRAMAAFILDDDRSLLSFFDGFHNSRKNSTSTGSDDEGVALGHYDKRQQHDGQLQLHLRLTD